MSPEPMQQPPREDLDNLQQADLALNPLPEVLVNQLHQLPDLANLLRTTPLVPSREDCLEVLPALRVDSVRRIQAEEGCLALNPKLNQLKTRLAHRTPVQLEEDCLETTSNNSPKQELLAVSLEAPVRLAEPTTSSNSSSSSQLTLDLLLALLSLPSELLRRPRARLDSEHQQLALRTRSVRITRARLALDSVRTTSNSSLPRVHLADCLAVVDLVSRLELGKQS